MSAAEKLMALHDRLITDRATAIVGQGLTVRPTEAGQAWLRDYHRYKRLWRDLELSGQTPETLLAEHFGFISDTEIIVSEAEGAEEPKERRATERAVVPRILDLDDLPPGGDEA